MKKITILLVDDHVVLRQGLRALLLDEPDFEVVGEAENGRQAVVLAAKLQPTVVVMDIAMPRLNGLEATRRIAVEAPGSKVVILSSHSDDEYVDRLTRAGAVGYLVKQAAVDDLVKAIRVAAQGGTYFSAGIAKQLEHRDAAMGSRRRQLARREIDAPLTTREREVVQLVAEGRGNKETATELGISVKTVAKYRQHAMAKLDLRDLAGITRYALAQGIIGRAPQVA